MMLPYFIDIVPMLIGKASGKIIGWRPEGTRILIKLDECEDNGLNGKYVSGTVSKAAKSYEEAVIQLDAPLPLRGQSFKWIFISPRYKWHGLYRLLTTWNVANVFLMNSSDWPDKVLSENMIAISLVKIDKSKTEGNIAILVRIINPILNTFFLIGLFLLILLLSYKVTTWLRS